MRDLTDAGFDSYSITESSVTGPAVRVMRLSGELIPKSAAQVQPSSFPPLSLSSENGCEKSDGNERRARKWKKLFEGHSWKEITSRELRVTESDVRV